MCEYNIDPGFTNKVTSLSASELQTTARSMTLGVKKCKSRRLAICARDMVTVTVWCF